MSEPLTDVDRPSDFGPEHIAYGDVGVRPTSGPGPEPAPEVERPAPVEEPLAKDSTESLELRSPSAKPARFRKGLLVASAAGLCSAVAGFAWIALQPAGLGMAAETADLHAADTQSAPEELAGLPTSYGDGASGAPILGQPLPGDLGRPILEHQRAMASEDLQTPLPASAPPDPAAQAAAAERQRRLAELVQARGAPVLMQVSRNASGSAQASARDDRVDAANAAPSSEGVNPNRLRPAASRWQISAGSTIAASLITGLNSDLPGMVVAQVSEPVFDSVTGRAVLIPQGARLLGRYDSKVAFGQRRALLVWERLVMPDGASIALDNAPATDAKGYAGLSDAVDFHTWQLLRGIGMSTLLGIGTELTFGDGEANLIRALRESIQTNADRAGQKIVERNLDIAPTITVRPGFPVRVLVQKDLVLPPWKG